MAREKSLASILANIASSFKDNPSAPHLAKLGYRPRSRFISTWSGLENYGLGITHAVPPQPYHAPRSTRPYRRPYVRR